MPSLIFEYLGVPNTYPNSNILIKIFPYTSFYQKHFVVAREVSAICQVCLLFGKLAFRAQHGDKTESVGHSIKEREMLSGIQNIRVTPWHMGQHLEVERLSPFCATMIYLSLNGALCWPACPFKLPQQNRPLVTGTQGISLLLVGGVCKRVGLIVRLRSEDYWFHAIQ